MKKFLKEYFSFSLSARRGIWILIIFIIIIMFSPLVIKYLYKNTSQIPDKKVIAEFDSALNLVDTNKFKQEIIVPKEPFNPNDYTESDWLKIGVKKHLAERICNYISKGGRFYKKEDLLKIYGFDSSIFNSISPYIQIKVNSRANKLTKEISYFKKDSKVQSEIEDLNTADTTALKKLPGIGSVLATRIIKYRNSLGGFYSVSQLAEVYGFNSGSLQVISNKVVVDTSIIKKIDLKVASEKELKNHPYIGKYKAAAIIKLRNFQKSGLSYIDLYKNGIFSKEEAEKLKFYLK